MNWHQVRIIKACVVIKVAGCVNRTVRAHATRLRTLILHAPLERRVGVIPQRSLLAHRVRGWEPQTLVLTVGGRGKQDGRVHVYVGATRLSAGPYQTSTAALVVAQLLTELVLEFLADFVGFLLDDGEVSGHVGFRHAVSQKRLDAKQRRPEPATLDAQSVVGRGGGQGTRVVSTQRRWYVEAATARPSKVQSSGYVYKQAGMQPLPSHYCLRFSPHPQQEMVHTHISILTLVVTLMVERNTLPSQTHRLRGASSWCCT